MVYYPGPPGTLMRMDTYRGSLRPILEKEAFMIQELEDVILTCDFPEQGLTAEQESEELGSEVITRLNPKTG